MPIYEFHCEKCNYVFEDIRSASDETCPACPICKSEQTRKLMSMSTLKNGANPLVNHGKETVKMMHPAQRQALGLAKPPKCGSGG